MAYPLLFIFIFIFPITSVFSKDSRCHLQKILKRNTELLAIERGKNTLYLYLGAHNYRPLINLLDLDLDDPEVQKHFDEPRELINYIQGAKSTSEIGLRSMKASLPGLLDFLRENKDSLQWLGGEVSPENFPLIERSIQKARRLRILFESQLTEEILPNKDQEIRDFIMASYGLDIYLAVYHPELIERLKLEPIESDKILKRNEPLVASLQKEFSRIRDEVCPADPQKQMCHVYNTTLQQIIVDLKSFSIADIDSILSEFPSSSLKTQMRKALIGALRWVQLQHDRDLAVAQKVFQLRGNGLIIMGRNHIKIAPSVQQLCEGKPLRDSTSHTSRTRTDQ